VRCVRIFSRVFFVLVRGKLTIQNANVYLLLLVLDYNWDCIVLG